MASSKLKKIRSRHFLMGSVKIPKPKETEDAEPKDEETTAAIPLPQTLVRIPTEHAPMLQQNSTGGGMNIE